MAMGSLLERRTAAPGGLDRLPKLGAMHQGFAVKGVDTAAAR